MKYFALILSAVALAGVAHADQLVTFTSTPESAPDRDLILGWQFTPNTDLRVSSLSYYDSGRDGLLTDHTVAIFNSGGTNLMQTLISSGTSNPLDGDFRTSSSINTYSGDGLLLRAGQTYLIAGSSPGFQDTWGYGNPSGAYAIPGYHVDSHISVVPTGAKFSYTSNFFDGGGKLNAPTDVYEYTHYFGPNLSTAPVPEPASMAALGIGAIGLLRRRRKSA